MDYSEITKALEKTFSIFKESNGWKGIELRLDDAERITVNLNKSNLKNLFDLFSEDFYKKTLLDNLMNYQIKKVFYTHFPEYFYDIFTVFYYLNENIYPILFKNNILDKNTI